jgi:erythromycin esterase-like protein
LFRTAGNIIRADINIGADGRPKGSGTVVFETSKDAAQAISRYLRGGSNTVAQLFISGMYHGFDWYGRTLEVREVG